MSEYDGNIIFKEWLPDLPELNNPGLTEARNTVFADGSYRSYAPSSPTGTAAPASAVAGMRALGFFNVTLGAVYVATHATAGSRILSSTPISGFSNWLDVTPSATTFNSQSGVIDLLQYEDIVIAMDGSNTPVWQTFGSSSTMQALSSTVGAAPRAQCGGVVGQFVVLDDLTAASPAVRWSGIDAPLDWPTPNSATAIAQQSGQQILDPTLNRVKGIAEGDQWGLVMQDGGITRMTYVGSPTVFAFDVVFRGPGPIGFHAWVQRGPLTYFASAAGFFVCDGAQVSPIGQGKVDRYFTSRVDPLHLNRVYAGVDQQRGLIFWTLPKTTDAVRGDAEEMLVYSYQDETWSHVFDTVRLFIANGEGVAASAAIAGFSHANRYVELTGTPGTAIFTTAEMEPNPAGYTGELGIKPLIDAGSITVATARRNNLTDAVSFGSETTANSRSGFASFRGDARYHRARLTLVGTFNAAQGLEYQAEATGYF